LQVRRRQQVRLSASTPPRDPSGRDVDPWLPESIVDEGGAQIQLSSDFWASKPAWCQPWSILSTGSTLIAAAWTLSSSNILVTVLVSVPVLLWWFLFLVLVPEQYKEAVQAQKADRN
ncbi:hypothetical protein V8C86DRAFT_2583735, partial [Haematococcus lacustris]